MTDAFRQLFDDSGLKAAKFAEVVKKRIVKLDWRARDLGADDPQRYPAGGEPENYVLGRKHNPEMAAEIGTIGEVVIEHTLDDMRDADIVRTGPAPFSRILVNEVAHRWFLANSKEWLTFETHP